MIVAGIILRIFKSNIGLLILLTTLGATFLIAGLFPDKKFLVKGLDGTKFKLPYSSEGKKFLTKIRELQEHKK